MPKRVQLARAGLVVLAVFATASCSYRAPAQPPTSAASEATQTPATPEPVPAAPQYSLGQPRIILRWQTETESNTFGYYVYRSDIPDSQFVCINAEHPVHSAGTSTLPLKYAYFDLKVEMGKTYYYRLQSRDLDASNEWIIGYPTPVSGTAKPMTDAELEEIRTKGKAYREDAD